MIRTKYILTIDKPCSEDWHLMTANGTGKYCSKCSKCVIDFSQLTDKEIIQVIENTNGKLCGHLEKEQLNRLIKSSEKSHKSRLYRILAGLLLISISENSFAQKQHEVQIVSKSKNENSKLNIIKETSQKSLQTDSLKNIIRGTVLDSTTREALPYAIIGIKNVGQLATTDINGKFEIIIPDALLSEKIVLTISSVGYKMTELTIFKKDLPMTKEILLSESNAIQMIGEIEVVKRKWWQRKS